MMGPAKPKPASRNARKQATIISILMILKMMRLDESKGNTYCHLLYSISVFSGQYSSERLKVSSSGLGTGYF